MINFNILKNKNNKTFSLFGFAFLIYKNKKLCLNVKYVKKNLKI